MKTTMNFNVSSQVQFYTLLLGGMLLSFMWPINLLYVFIVTRAYVRDKDKLFQSVFLETKEQTNNTIRFIKTLSEKLDNKQKSKAKNNDITKNKEDVIGDNVKSDSESNNSPTYNLRKRNNVVNEEEVDTI